MQSMEFMEYKTYSGACLQNAVIFLLPKYVKLICRGIFNMHSHMQMQVFKRLKWVGFPAVL